MLHRTYNILAGEGDAVCAWNAIAYNAEDNGLLRVTDIGQMNLNNICGLCATPDAIENRLDLITKAWMVYYMTWEWCQESEENMAKAVELYVESCEDEGLYPMNQFAGVLWKYLSVLQ